MKIPHFPKEPGGKFSATAAAGKLKSLLYHNALGILVYYLLLNDARVDQSLDNPKASIKAIFYLNLFLHQKSSLV